MGVFVEPCSVLQFVTPSENVIITETMHVSVCGVLWCSPVYCSLGECHHHRNNACVFFMGSCSVLQFIAPAWNAFIAATMPANICRVLKCSPGVCPMLWAVAWADQLTKLYDVLN